MVVWHSRKKEVMGKKLPFLMGQRGRKVQMGMLLQLERATPGSKGLTEELLQSLKVERGFKAQRAELSYTRCVNEI
ncbi:hypothetical protein [Methylophaga thalassica]|uniref:hypothetical protein n=1 Tax=Methylophaga aminisulfidivorans TaxID=230105 RepID=UPI003A920768